MAAYVGGAFVGVLEGAGSCVFPPGTLVFTVAGGLLGKGGSPTAPTAPSSSGPPGRAPSSLRALLAEPLPRDAPWFRVVRHSPGLLAPSPTCTTLCRTGPVRPRAVHPQAGLGHSCCYPLSQHCLQGLFVQPGWVLPPSASHTIGPDQFHGGRIWPGPTCGPCERCPDSR